MKKIYCDICKEEIGNPIYKSPMDKSDNDKLYYKVILSNLGSINEERTSVTERSLDICHGCRDNLLRYIDGDSVVADRFGYVNLNLLTSTFNMMLDVRNSLIADKTQIKDKISFNDFVKNVNKAMHRIPVVAKKD